MILIYTFPFLDANGFDEAGDKEARKLESYEARMLGCRDAKIVIRYPLFVIRTRAKRQRAN
jgi:hypothetical protein